MPSSQNVRYGWISSLIHSPRIVVCILQLHEDKAIYRQSRQLSAPAKNEGMVFGRGHGFGGDAVTDLIAFFVLAILACYNIITL